MNDLTIDALYSSIDNIINENQDMIEQTLFRNADSSMSAEEVIARKIPNCLSLSVKLSVQLTLELLQSHGLFEIDEREISKLYLKHLSSEKED